MKRLSTILLPIFAIALFALSAESKPNPLDQINRNDKPAEIKAKIDNALVTAG
ncbi:MAG: hypothetical protein ACKVGW_09410 [Verrucomicrobiia bacterium]|jgi:hypothetical protein